MEKEKTFKIITKKAKPYAEKLKIKYDTIYLNNPTKTLQQIGVKKPSQVEIYDITTTKKAPYLSFLKLSDHINKTGENPIIGLQKKFPKDLPNVWLSGRAYTSRTKQPFKDKIIQT